jgi:methylated-DNA-[protein]-cysteine S-methyltransferase
VPSRRPAWWRQATPVGEVLIETNADGAVVRLALPADDVVDPPGRPRRDAVLGRRITAWGRGQGELTDVPVDLAGADLSDFQRHVLLTLRAEVPAGETVTYGELAEIAGRPGAARAVGTAMRRNPVQLLIPCHRVVAANGIGGYGGGPAGTALKRVLLAREGRGRPSA